GVQAREAANAASKTSFSGEIIDETFDKEIRCVCGFVGSFASTLPDGSCGSGPRLLLGSGTPIAHESCGCGGISATFDATSGAKFNARLYSTFHAEFLATNHDRARCYGGAA